MIRERSSLQSLSNKPDEIDGLANTATREIPFIDEDEEESITNKEESCNIVRFDESDGKWRPILLTVGLMYKLQKVLDDNWYDVPDIFIKDNSTKKNLIDTFAWYWHYFYKVN